MLSLLLEKAIIESHFVELAGSVVCQSGLVENKDTYLVSGQMSQFPLHIICRVLIHLLGIFYSICSLGCCALLYIL